MIAFLKPNRTPVGRKYSMRKYRVIEWARWCLLLSWPDDATRKLRRVDVVELQ